MEGVNDILHLNNFSEMSLIHTLRTRYQQDHIYTWVGPILVAINPYKWAPGLYSVNTMMKYNNKSETDLPPHLFAIVDTAYQVLYCAVLYRAVLYCTVL